MTSVTRRVMVFTAVTTVAGASLAHAQVSDPVEFTMPFAFTVGNTTMPAGSYEIRRDTDNGTVYRIECAEEAHRYAVRGRTHLDEQAAGEDRGRLQALRSGLRAQVRVGGRVVGRHPDADGGGGKASRQAWRDRHGTRACRPSTTRPAPAPTEPAAAPARAPAVQSTRRRPPVAHFPHHSSHVRPSTANPPRGKPSYFRSGCSTAGVARDPSRRRAP